MEFLEDFAIEKLGVVENNVTVMMDKLDLIESSLSMMNLFRMIKSCL
jgi:hypothetical protein